MASFSHAELSDQLRLKKKFAELPHPYRAAIVELVRSADQNAVVLEPDLPSSPERVSDGEHGRKMLQYLQQGMLKYPAALKVCMENPALTTGLSSCARRLVRKYDAGRFGRVVANG